MAKKLSKVGIVTNQLVLPHQVTQSIDAFTGEEDYDINLSGSLAITGSTTIKLGGLTISDSVLGPGSLNVTNITASNLQVVNISSSFVTSSTIYTSGSNIFGDEPSDTHTFIGGITASGVMSASGVVFGSQVRTPAVFTNTITEKTSTSGVTIEGTLLKDNNISTAGTITAGGNTSIPRNSKFILDGDDGSNSYITQTTSNILQIVNQGNTLISAGSANLTFTSIPVIISNQNFTVTGGVITGDGAGLTNIPAAGITGLNLSRIESGSVTASISPDKGFEVNTNITSSGNISANGNIQNLDGYALFQRTSTGVDSVLNVRQLSTGNIAEFGTNTNNELVIIKSDGKVGIGTNSPTEALHTKTTGNTVAKFETSLSSDLAIQLTNSQGSMFFGLGGGEEFAVGTTSDLNGTDNLFIIEQNGNVGIGNTSPSQKLDVTGNIKVSGDIETATFTNPTLDIAAGSANMTANIPLTFGALLAANLGRLDIKHDNSNGSITNRSGDLTIGNTAANSEIILDSTNGVKISNIADNSNTGYKTVVVDTSTGQLYRTGSYGGGGGGGGAGIFIQTGSYYATTNDLQVTGSLTAEGLNVTSAISASMGAAPYMKLNLERQLFGDTDGNSNGATFVLDQNSGFAVGSPIISLDGAVTINDSSNNYDFRVESNGNANMLFVDAGTNRVGIGTNSPTEALDVTGNIVASGEMECTKFVANAAGGFEFEIDGDNQFNMIHNFANRSMFFTTAAGTGTINFGTNAQNSQVSITSAGNLNVVNDLTVGGSVTTGAITASGDISCSFQESTITATTGSFNHIITDGETLEFRDATTRAKVGALKFDATNGLEVKDSAGNEGKLKTKELNIPSGGSMIIDASQINFNSLPTSDPGVAGRLWRDSRDGKIVVSG
jgi:hypothetical protein